MRTISIVIPAYNEEQFIDTLLEKILQVPTETAGFKKQIIVVDDGSRDKTAEKARAFQGVKVVQQSNAGKGAAVQRGVREADGDLILVQDADLEYDPVDYIPLLKAVGQSKNVAVYGSRPLGVLRDQGWRWPFPAKQIGQGIGPWSMNIILSVWAFILYRLWITDLLTAYKIYPATIMKEFDVKTRGFETDHELTAKLVKGGVSIVEIPISYKSRSRAEGKKIRPKDGLIALWTLLKYRFVD